MQEYVPTPISPHSLYISPRTPDWGRRTYKICDYAHRCHGETVHEVLAEFLAHKNGAAETTSTGGGGGGGGGGGQANSGGSMLLTSTLLLARYCRCNVWVSLRM